MPNDDSGQVFDVSKPNRTMPDPTARPIIVGHRPTMNDPMVQGTDTAQSPPQPQRSIPVMGASDTPSLDTPAPPPVVADHPESVSAATSGVPGMGMNASISPEGDLHLGSMDGVTPPESRSPEGPVTSVYSPTDGGPPKVTMPHDNPPKSGKKWLWALLVLLVLLIGAYLAIDDNLIASGVNLPFHVFKQPVATPAPSAATNTPKTTNTTPTIPTGFTAYSITGTTLSFDYPTTWGTPAQTADPGYSSRSSTAKSDGTYAYIVNFATNKDVQLVVTSAKYLPATRTPLYYDYLQWCVGSNDNKIYKSLMHFTTANKVDTPSTVTCDQGPLTDATKLNSFTIEQPKTKNADGSILGDLYTVNLKETDVPVLRVRDATSANTDNIKTLLNTIKSSDDGGTGVTTTAQ